MRRELYQLPERSSCELVHDFVPADQRAGLFAALCAELPLSLRAIRVFGREVLQPRLVAFVGDADAAYTYSGTLHQAAPWSPVLAALTAQVSEHVGLRFNAVLCNLYRDGRDSMGLHADAEPELGARPVIASLSLGAERRFVIRARQKQDATKLDLVLPSGSLLVMGGEMQLHYKHGVPKQPAITEPRLNLTFRRIYSESERLRRASRSMP